MSTISSSTTSTTAYKVTADTTGTLVLQTGATPTTAVTIDASQNVGIGTSLPADNLHVYVNTTTENGIRVQNANASGQSAVQYYNNAGTQKADVWWNNNGSTFNVRTLSTDPLIFYTNNSERMRVNAGAPILCLSGGNTSATGTGIAFPATQSASSDVNTLDDYEEGTWTPSLGGTATYSQQGGTYKKVGALVYVSAILQVATLGTGSSNQISGFPFTCSAGPRNTLAVAYFNSTVGSLVYLAFYIGIGGSFSNTVATTAAATGVADGYGVFQSGTYVMFSGCYHAS